MRKEFPRNGERRMKSRFMRGEVKVVTRFIRYRDKEERRINVAWQINFRRFKYSLRVTASRSSPLEESLFSRMENQSLRCAFLLQA